MEGHVEVKKNVGLCGNVPAGRLRVGVSRCDVLVVFRGINIRVMRPFIHKRPSGGSEGGGGEGVWYPRPPTWRGKDGWPASPPQTTCDIPNTLALSYSINNNI